MKSWITIILVWLLVSSAGAQSIGQKLGNFQFQDLDGQKVSLEELTSRTELGAVVLTFWCTTCNSCRDTERYFQKLSEEYEGKATVVAVSSSRYDSPKKIRAYFKRNKFEIPIILDTDSALAHHFGVYRTTTTAVLDGSRRLRYYGTLKRRKKLYAQNSLDSVLKKKIVGQPKGPIFG